MLKKLINKNKGTSGITLIALIITVILMLILAGVAILAITGQEGMFNKVSDATKEYKKQSLIEAVNSAKLQLQLDNAIDKNIEINMSNLIDKLKETSEINEKDYIISDIEVNEETGAETVTIVDKKTGVVLDITMETNGKVTIETSIVDDISKVTRPVIELTLEPEEGTYAETVIIKVTVTEEANGIAKIQIPDENLTVNTYNNEKQVTFDFPVTENSTYTFIAENANGRKTTKLIEVKNTMSVRDITIENLGGEVTKSPTNIKISYDANPRIGGQVLTNTNKYQYIIGTESETNTWKTVTTTIEEETGLAVATIPVNENGEIHARYFDGTNGHKTKTFSIDNIDDEKPKIIEATASTSWGATNSITLKATDAGSTNCATGNYGIIGYGINQSTETEPTYTECNATTSLSTEIKNITANGTYVVWVKDKAGNTAKTQVTVNRVDTLAPTTATLAVVENSITTTTFTLKATGTDATATNASGASGIAKYEFYVKDATGKFVLEKTINSTNTTENYAVSGKTEGTEYTYKVIVYDAAGKSKTSAEINVQTVAIIIGKIEATYIGTRTFDIELTVESGEDKVTEIEYFVDGVSKSKTTEQTYTSEEFEPETIHKVYAILYSSTGKGYKTNELTITTEPRTYLYNNGDECIELTGGWRRGANNNGSFTKYENYMNLQGRRTANAKLWNSVETVNLIDFSEYKSIYIEVEFDTQALVQGYYRTYFEFGIANPRYSSYSANNFKLKIDGINLNGSALALNTPLQFSTDLTDISGYVTAYWNIWYDSGFSNCNMKIYNVWLEK